jgi:indole-3-glycerol phosphate synthase
LEVFVAGIVSGYLVQHAPLPVAVVRQDVLLPAQVKDAAAAAADAVLLSAAFLAGTGRSASC